MTRNRLLSILIFLAIILPLVAIEYFSYRELERELLAQMVSERKSVVSLSATMLKERFDRVMDLAVSLSTRIQFRDLVRRGRWDDAIAILEDLPREFPFIERIFLSDTLGTLRSDYPPLPGVRGRNFAFRDWYRGVSDQWTPYLSQVFKRAATPQLNVVAVSCPIHDENGSVYGILVVQIALKTLVDWIGEIDPGNEGVLFVLDHSGMLAAHPGRNPHEELLDYSTHPAYQSAITDVQVYPDSASGRRIIGAFAPVPGYGWVVVAEQSEDAAAAVQRNTLLPALAVFVVTLILASVLALLIIRFLVQNQKARMEIQHLNKDLEDRARELEIANKELEAFSYSVSHDLRAPLRHIDGFVQLLSHEIGDTIDNEGKRLIRVISDSAKRMGQLIDELLAFSKAGRIVMASEHIDMNHLVQEVLKNHESEIHRRNVRINVGPMPSVTGDAAMLRQVWENLISNALKFTGKKDGPEIVIGHAQEQERHVFHVRDNGAGFDLRYADKLFGVFQRLHIVDEFDGTGIGLAIVKRTIERHGGNVWADGIPEKGATFFFSLPAGR